MNTSPLFETLYRLERQLHSPEVRADPHALGQLLHPGFREFARSGEIYTREQVLGEFSDSPPDYIIWSQDFALEEIQDGLSLLTYRSAHVTESGELERHTLRASLWQRTAGGWTMRFHQGTPAEAFAKQVV
jgi:hypothetical protein